jgi:hypothetical protein
MIATLLNVDLGKYAARSTQSVFRTLTRHFAFYEALSLLCVAWADTSDSAFLAPNGKEFHVTRNLGPPPALTN